jgi:hypothetical protein
MRSSYCNLCVNDTQVAIKRRRGGREKGSAKNSKNSPIVYLNAIFLPD